jgi:hypothetical protein
MEVLLKNWVYAANALSGRAASNRGGATLRLPGLPESENTDSDNVAAS